MTPLWAQDSGWGVQGACHLGTLLRMGHTRGRPKGSSLRFPVKGTDHECPLCPPGLLSLTAAGRGSRPGRSGWR